MRASFTTVFLPFSIIVENGKLIAQPKKLVDTMKHVTGIESEKEQTLEKLFELLESYAERSIGKRFGLNEVCNSRQEIIKAISNTR